MLDMKRALDLKALAATCPVTPGDYLTARYAFPVADGAVALELVAPQGSGHVAATDEDVFVFVLDGQFAINDHIMVVGQGSKVTAGTAFEWSATPGTRVFVMGVKELHPSEPGVVQIDPAAAMSLSSPPPAEYLTGPTPVCQSAPAWRTCDGQFYGGIWSATPYCRKKVPYVHDEFMYLLEGSVSFVNEAGEEQTFRAGDAFLICRGASCSWESRDVVKKVYVIFRPTNG
ncbi:cupin domain-containing protein [Acetobacter sp. LMG 32666]|uniref:cupin domain-containing protein n=1 Tax=Acetobacter sp. LMG 32666 TaxID=2959295 RepID=UPI0030C8777A